MALTLSVIAGITLLLPGLFGILFWNARARRYAASRPDLPITAISVLAMSISVSLLVHLLAWYIFLASGYLAVQIGNGLSWLLPAQWFTPLPFVANPIETIFKLTNASVTGTVRPVEVALLGITIVLEVAFIAKLVNDDGFDLLLEGSDFGNQGWVHSHIVRPAQNGYRPIAYVLTTLTKEGLGIGYRGIVADIRQSDRGETLAISLTEPERFLFELKNGKPAAYGAPEVEPGFVRYQDESVGSLVSLDGKVIQNIVISNPNAQLLEELGKLLDDSGLDALPVTEADV